MLWIVAYSIVGVVAGICVSRESVKAGDDPVEVGIAWFCGLVLWPFGLVVEILFGIAWILGKCLMRIWKR